MLTTLTKDISISKDIDLKDIASKLNGKSLADVAFVIKEAALNSGKVGLDEISNQAIIDAVNTLPKNKKEEKLGLENNE